MENKYYTEERNVQILLFLLKAHGIRKVIVSPGSTNIAVVGSMEHDPFFEMYSCVDERSAAYMACGLAAESGEPVVLSCTGATASRNYYPGLTEAFYRKLPILALTSSQDSRKMGHLKDQITDRTCPPADVVKLSTLLQNVRDEDDEWDVTIKANRAIQELNHHGKGPVHINIETTYCRKFPVKTLPEARVIKRYTYSEPLPTLPTGKIAVFIGSHIRMTKNEEIAIDNFCKSNNAVVFCEPCSGYKGKYAIFYSLASWKKWTSDNQDIDLLIHLGEISGFIWQCSNAKEIWRVSEDGELRDLLKKLTKVFEMREIDFFEHYSNSGMKGNDSYLRSCLDAVHTTYQNVPELPFSNLWIANKIHKVIPQGSMVHLGILAPLRSWNYMGINSAYESDCNQGGFGIDGNLSTLIGASLVHPDKLYFGVVGDLSFFYDMNSLGNRHIKNNIRILVVNNGLGCEFRLFNQVGNILGEETNKYISAAGHFGNKSPRVIKALAENWGYEYITASSKEEFTQVYERFITPELTDKPMIFEVFTKVEDENEALQLVENFGHEENKTSQTKAVVKKLIGNQGLKVIKRILKK